MTRLALLFTFLSAVACGHGNPPETPPGLPPTDSVPILKYEIIAHPPAVVGSSGRTLKVTAAYHGTESVKVSYISIGISVGGEETDLVPAQDAKDIDFAFSPDWKPYNPHPDPAGGYVTFNLLPSSGSSHTFNNGDTVTFEFDNVSINTVAGPAKIKITEGTVGDPSEFKRLTKWPQGSDMTNIVFSANHTVIHPDVAELRLRWSGGPADATYELEYYTPKDGDKKIPLPGANGEYPAKAEPGIKLEHDTLFYLTATYQGNSETLFLAVTVSAPLPKVTKLSGRFISNDGMDRLHLSWRAVNADYCLITDATAHQKLSVLDYPITPAPTKPLLTTYTVTAILKKTGVSATKTAALVWGVDAPGSPVEGIRDPVDVAVSPDSAKVFVTSADGTVSVLDAKTLRPVEGSPFGGYDAPTGIAVSPDGARVFVTNLLDDTISVIDADTFQPVKKSPVHVGIDPGDIAVSPDSSRVFVVNAGGNTVSVFDANSLQPIKESPVKVGRIPFGVAVSPDGARVFVTNSVDGTVSVLNADTLQPVEGSPVKVGRFPFGVAVSPDSSRVFVANTKDSTVSAFNAHTMQPVKGSPEKVGGGPAGVALSPDGARVFVVNNDDGTVSVLDANTLHPVNGAPVKVGSRPTNVAVSPDGARVFVTNGGSNTVSVIIPSGLEPVTE